MPFDFEKLDVFNLSVETVVAVDRVVDALPRGRGYIRDQLRRSANSIPLNIAEGAGEFAPREKSRFYRIAKRSATETAAQLIVLRRLGLGEERLLREVEELLMRVVAMLVATIRSCERRVH